MVEGKDNPIKQKSHAFAVRIVKACRVLYARNYEKPLITQILRSGTAIGASVCEGEFAQSRADFIHKMSVALKEANETKYWLEIFNETSILTGREFVSLYSDCKELIGLLVAIVTITKGQTPKAYGEE